MLFTAAMGSIRQARVGDMHSKRVLMIDNDHFSLSVLHRLLSEMGFNPLIGSTADAAQTLLDGEPADLIVYNRDLESEWGFSMLEQLRRSQATADVPVILLSQSVERFAPRIEEMDEYTVCFQKPIAIEQFVSLFLELVKDDSPAAVRN